jgi:hypothetical protein
MLMDRVYVSRSTIEGQGVFAARSFCLGEAILRIDDSRVVTDRNPLDPQLGEYERHCDYLEGGKLVHMQEPERYINHSCEPNVYVTWIGGERFVVARREIQQDEEITYDYCIDGGGDTVWECHCGSPICRGTLHSDFFHLPLEKQEVYFAYLSDWYVRENRANFERLKAKMRL